MSGALSTESDMNESTVQNRLLRALPDEALAKLRPSLQRVQIAPGEKLQRIGQGVETALFLESGLLSCFTGESGREQTEVALIGREGMSGVTALLGSDRDHFNLVAQRAGEGYRIAIDRLEAACLDNAQILGVIHRYAYALMVQIAETGRANARQTVEARLARWLLMAHDRIDGSEIELTHEALSMILGVRRPGITVALHVLEGDHMIRARRGAIEIVDRAKLEIAAKGSYGLTEREYERVLGPARTDRAA